MTQEQAQAKADRRPPNNFFNFFTYQKNILIYQDHFYSSSWEKYTKIEKDGCKINLRLRGHKGQKKGLYQVLKIQTRVKRAGKFFF